MVRWSQPFVEWPLRGIREKRKKGPQDRLFSPKWPLGPKIASYDQGAPPPRGAKLGLGTGAPLLAQGLLAAAGLPSGALELAGGPSPPASCPPSRQARLRSRAPLSPAIRASAPCALIVYLECMHALLLHTLLLLAELCSAT